jgi:hypothetical protein
MTNYKSLQKYRKIYFSQNGEDGMLEHILSKISSNKWAVEFGAWDGKYLSNTYHFIERHGYSAVLIEGDGAKMMDLNRNTEQFGDKVKCINAFVEPSGSNSLDNLLKSTAIPVDFDLLSIDIDGMDYFIWQSLLNYRPKVVIIEINIADKPGKVRVHDVSMTNYVQGESGSSIESIKRLANEKGYALLANIACNAIFVDRKYLKNYFENEPDTNEVFTYESFDLSQLTLSEANYKGKEHFVAKLIRLPWHAIRKCFK